MLAVLGIDAAWTMKNPSGVALIARDGNRWRCVSLAPSYPSFLEGASWDSPCEAGGEADVPALLARSRRLAGSIPAVVAVDMPLSLKQITGRRKADQLISEEFGAAKCSVHSPTADRPGGLADRMRCAFTETHPLATSGTVPGTTPRLLEVYPHVALLKLTGAVERLRYKIASSRRHTPGTPAHRLGKIREVYVEIVAALENHIDGVPPELMICAKKLSVLGHLKPFEDALDALICAWVGAMYLDGRAEAYGDEEAAIWVPKAGVVA